MSPMTLKLQQTAKYAFRPQKRIGLNNGNMQIEFYLCVLAIVSVAIV